MLKRLKVFRAQDLNAEISIHDLHDFQIKTHPLFTYPKNMCEITEYADAYFRSQGRNPFQKREPITKEGKEDKGKGKEGEGKPKSPPAKK